MSPRWERARLIAKLAMLGLLTWQVYEIFERPSRNTLIRELHGGWIVDSFTLDGTERTVATDGERWQKVAFNPHSVWVIPTTGFREALPIKVDTDNREVTVTLADRTRDKDRPKNKDGKPDQEIWKYKQPAPDHLEIDGEHRGRASTWPHTSRPSRCSRRAAFAGSTRSRSTASAALMIRHKVSALRWLRTQLARIRTGATHTGLRADRRGAQAR